MESTVNSHAPSTHQFDIDGGGFDEPESRRPLTFWAGMAAALAAVVLLVAGFLVRGTLMVSRADLCSSVPAQLTAVNKLDLQGSFAQASALAHATLAEPAVCSGDRQQLALVAYHADLSSLLSTPHQPGDVAGETAVIASWHSIEAFGQRHLSPGELESPSQVLGLAYSLGYFGLTRDIWLTMWEHGENRTSGSYNLYVSTLVNLGREYVTQAPSSYRGQGLRYLALAQQLGDRLGLQRGEAGIWLRRYTGQGPKGWPKPAPDPLLGALEHKKPSR